MNTAENHRLNLRSPLKQLKREIPEVMAAFGGLHQAGGKEGTLSVKQKELIALGISIGIRCESCIAFHLTDALKAGATVEEINETIGVSIVMGGGPALMYGAITKNFLTQLMDKK